MPTGFTIAIPTHDRRETAVLAARSALAQTRPAGQVLVLCDGCTDGTAEALGGLGAPRLEALELPKAPGYGYEHRNRSLELASGDAILWLADDDLLAPDHLERIGELWDTGRFDLVQSDGVVVHPDDRLEWFGADWSLPAARTRLALTNSNPMSSVSLRVDVALAVGGWDAGHERAADWDLWQRALAAGARSARCPEPTVVHFRASARAQAWPLRVRQNAAWLEQLADPHRAQELRIRLYRTGAQREADTGCRADDRERDFVALRQELAATRSDLAQTQEQIVAIEAERTAAVGQLTADVQRLEATLAAIFAGGWWRLRSRLGLPLPIVNGARRRRGRDRGRP